MLEKGYFYYACAKCYVYINKERLLTIRIHLFKDDISKWPWNMWMDCSGSIHQLVLSSPPLGWVRGATLVCENIITIIIIQRCKKQFENHCRKVSTNFPFFEQPRNWFDWARVSRPRNPRCSWTLFRAVSTREAIKPIYIVHFGRYLWKQSLEGSKVGTCGK